MVVNFKLDQNLLYFVNLGGVLIAPGCVLNEISLFYGFGKQKLDGFTQFKSETRQNWTVVTEYYYIFGVH